ncbi:MAG: hypothetical protein M3299_07760 [Thermoproteota archaeon]|nr:hypothetical protein [Thermoproteota archaeon]
MSVLAAAGGIPLALAEEDISLDETRGMVSDVLDGSDDEVDDADAKIDQGSTDTVTANPNQDGSTIDQTDSNEFGDNTAVSIDIDEEEQQQQLTLAPPPDDGPPVSEDLVFCFEGGLILGILCSSTLEDCEFVQERLESVISKCEGFETPPGGAFCFISEDGKNIKCESRN